MLHSETLVRAVSGTHQIDHATRCRRCSRRRSLSLHVMLEPLAPMNPDCVSEGGWARGLVAEGLGGNRAARRASVDESASPVHWSSYHLQVELHQVRRRTPRAWHGRCIRATPLRPRSHSQT